ncbi:MAG TPA: hypothetical protein VGR96_01685, partial [Acidobacteriaceae bacterium]|nr:hypothetical protein [Acidobacteriaceae bacterium]
AIELQAGGAKYSFRIDGSMYRMATGDLAVWKQVDTSTWSTQYCKPDGKPLETSVWKLSSDGSTLTVMTSGTKPNGREFTDTSVYARTAGTSGLLGSWKSTEVVLSAPDELTITGNGLDGLSIQIPSTKTSILGVFNGKDAVPSGPDVPPGLTVALKRVGPSSFRLVEKINGFVAYSSIYSMSEDGKTLTQTGNSPGDPVQTAVWEKQYPAAAADSPSESKAQTAQAPR